MTVKIGLFYGSTTCYTEMAGEKMCEYINQTYSNIVVELYDIGLNSVQRMADYQYLILGIPTWDFGELQEDWESIWDEIDSIDLKGTVVALYGLGDQIGYPEWFQDALGYLWAKVKAQGASTVGTWPIKDYEFKQSKALTDDGKLFVGLSLDDENQSDLTDMYIEQWCIQIINEFKLS
jgi:flavodoxin II